LKLLSSFPRYLALIFREFFEIYIYRKRPQDLPSANELLWLSIGIYTLLSGLIAYLSQPFIVSVLSALIESVMLIIITFLFLYLRSVPGRWIQVTTAVAGTGAIFSIIVFPLYYTIGFIQVSVTVLGLIQLLIIIMWLWYLSVLSYILKNALSSSYILAALGALAYIAIIMLSLQQIFPISRS
jgi:hypothetical protein